MSFGLKMFITKCFIQKIEIPLNPVKEWYCYLAIQVSSKEIVEVPGLGFETLKSMDLLKGQWVQKMILVLSFVCPSCQMVAWHCSHISFGGIYTLR